MAGLFVFMAFQFAESVECLQFPGAEAVGGDDGEVVKPAITIFVSRQVIGVAVAEICNLAFES